MNRTDSTGVLSVRGKRAISARSQTGKPERGAILLEVLLSIALLGLVTSSLLSAFQQTRRVEREVSQALFDLDSFSRLIDLLELDLNRARGLKLLVNEQQTGEGLQILTSPSEKMLYQWDKKPGVLRRTRFINEEISFQSEHALAGRVEFEPVLAKQTVLPGFDMNFSTMVKAIRVRFLSSNEEAIERAMTIALPVPFPVTTERGADQ